MTNEQLVIRIKAGENVADHMEQLYNQTRRFIHSIAWRFRGSGEMEDLEQEGYLALYDAIDGFNPAAGCKFLTYAEYWIRQRMQRYIQMNGSCMRLPVHCQEKVRQYERFVSEYEREHGREPSEWEIEAHLGFTPEQIEEIRKSACMAKRGSLDSPVCGLDGGEDATVGELVAAPADLEADVLDRVQHEQLCAVLWECVDSLEGRQPEVIRKRYQEGRTMAAIGADYGVTGEVIRQMESKALRELRKPRNSKRLRPFVLEDEKIYSMALRGNGVGRFNRTWTSSTEWAALKVMDQEEQYQKHLEWLEEYRGKVRQQGGSGDMA